MRTSKIIALGIVSAVALAFQGSLDAVENVKGKSYRLTRDQGPWMIMVTSFRNVRDPDQKTEGMTAEQAAAQLVFDLREKGIPAYAFEQNGVVAGIDTHDRLGREDHRIYAAQRDMICVLAGNYDKPEDKNAKKTLEYIKKFHPKFLSNPKSGAIMRADANKRGPLAGAFMTINPLISPDEVKDRAVDPLIKSVNSNSQFSLLTVPKKYTVRVASFSGRTVTPLGNSSYRGREKAFDQELQSAAGFGINRAAEDAEQLTNYIRKKRFHANGPIANDLTVYESYVFHSKYDSIVTIGGFDSKDDPRIQSVIQYYGPKIVPDFRYLDAVKNKSDDPQEVVERLPKILTNHTEMIFPEGANPKTDKPLQIWTFEWQPEVIAIPRVK